MNVGKQRTSIDTRQELIRVLADGRFHSGAALGRGLGLTRAAIWKQIEALSGYGLDIERVRGRGYRLAAPLELLDAGWLRAAVNDAASTPLAWLEVLSVVDSTNLWLRARLDALAPGSPAACLAECQTAGRGRRGRSWVSPYGANLSLSVAWHLGEFPPEIGALSLAVGLAAADALEDCGFADVALKWPNDLIHNDRKLGGVLVDLEGQPGGDCRVVAGVGINILIPARTITTIDQPWTDLAAMRKLPEGIRNRLALRLIRQLLDAAARFSADGLTSFVAAWRRRDILAGREVRVASGAETYSGTALGIDGQGALRVRTNEGIRRFFSGDVSVRAVASDR